MKRKATRTDFFREIKGSLGRFFSLFFIVALGTAFFSGIRSAQPDMLVTADTYFDRSKLMDIKAVSTLGITKEDVKAVEQVTGVKEANGGYSTDARCVEETDQRVLHIMSLLKTMNEVKVTEGRLPKTAGECLVDSSLDYNIGDIIRLDSGTDKDITDTLSTDTLKVVGVGNSPCYISFSRGSSTIGTGTIQGFVYTTEDTFTLDVYTEVYVTAKGTGQLTAYSQAYEDGVEAVMENIEQITKERGEIRKADLARDAEEEINKAANELASEKQKAQEQLAKGALELADGEAAVLDGRQQIESGRNQIESAKATLGTKQKELDNAVSQYYDGLAKWQEGETAYYEAEAQFHENEAAYSAQIYEGRQMLAEERAKMDAGWNQYRQMQNIPDPAIQAQAEALKAQLEQGEAAYARGKAELDGYEQMLIDGRAQLALAQTEIVSGKTELDSAWTQIQEGQLQINAGWEECSKQQTKLEDAQRELDQREPELAAGRQSYEEAKVKADSQIAEGEKKIQDAKQEIDAIEEAKWYINDRATLPEYTGYGENADRMKAIGKVFPVIFFLVAALISLTSMTRMVEEQRIQIGTMKALGYGKFAIASKYLGYALAATLGGSIFGVLIGEKILPYIIIFAYGMMYHQMDGIYTPYNIPFAVMATGAALVCTMAATALACYKELAAHPAVLMRPPSPKKGKRVFLERVPFIWKHLSFIWKSTIRNLFRYKKRFFMTVFGIGGCMALLLVGYGIRDSIFNIGGLQYKEIQVYDGMAYYKEDAAKEEKEQLSAYMSDGTQIEESLEVDMRNITLVNGQKEREAFACVPKDAKQMEEFVAFRDRITKTSYSLSDDGVILSEKTAKLLDVKAGDTIEIKDTENGNKRIKIAEICENYMGHYVYLSEAFYERIYGKQPSFNCVYFKASNSERKALNTIGEGLLKQDAVQNVVYLYEYENQLENMLSSLDLVIVVLIISAGMLAFVVLYNLNNINITERRRELATIKVLGFYDSEVSAYVYRENIILTIVGAIAGVVMGAVLHRYIIVTVEVDSVMFGRNINLPSYLYSVLFTFAFSIFVNGVMYFKLKKIDMVESLKSIE